MDVDAAVGKIIGMVMAYAVSFLGLLLAYHNHRKRAGKAAPEETPPAAAGVAPAIERQEEPTAKQAAGAHGGDALLEPRPWILMGLVSTALVLLAAAFSSDQESTVAAIVSLLPGIVVPGLVFALSFWVTWALYRRFSGGAR